ncbi:MAG: hypothetical protein PVG39_28655, partial [Desulfobacteraceae bacterium]
DSRGDGKAGMFSCDIDQPPFFSIDATSSHKIRASTLAGRTRTLSGYRMFRNFYGQRTRFQSALKRLLKRPLRK